MVPSDSTQLRIGYAAMAETLEKIRLALKGYSDSDLVSLATTVMLQADALNKLPTGQMDYIRGLIRASDIANQFGFEFIGEPDDETAVEAKMDSRQAQMIAACEVSRLIYGEVIQILLGKTKDHPIEDGLFTGSS